MTDDGEVKSVTINGKKEFDSDDKYRLDAEVVVTYHTLKKNKPILIYAKKNKSSLHLFR